MNLGRRIVARDSYFAGWAGQLREPIDQSGRAWKGPRMIGRPYGLSLSMMMYGLVRLMKHTCLYVTVSHPGNWFRLWRQIPVQIQPGQWNYFPTASAPTTYHLPSSRVRCYWVAERRVYEEPLHPTFFLFLLIISHSLIHLFDHWFIRAQWLAQVLEATR